MHGKKVLQIRRLKPCTACFCLAVQSGSPFSYELLPLAIHADQDTLTAPRRQAKFSLLGVRSGTCQDQGACTPANAVSLIAGPLLAIRSSSSMTSIHFVAPPQLAQVALQHDHHSFFVITWMGGVGAAWLHEAILVGSSATI
eukprot:1153064-Pelagomonas_calceolata.AAC.6